MTINSSNLGPVSVFAKFNGGFQTQSSDAVDRKRSLTTYFVDSADRDWYLDVHANNGNSTLYTFVMHGSVLTASPSLGGRTEGVIGIQFEIDGERVYSLASFASKFVDLFRNVCNDPNFFFRHSASNYFSSRLEFPSHGRRKYAPMVGSLS